MHVLFFYVYSKYKYYIKTVAIVVKSGSDMFLYIFRHKQFNGGILVAITYACIFVSYKLLLPENRSSH